MAAALVLLSVFLWVAIKTDWFHEKLHTLTEDILSKSTGQHIRFERIGGIPPVRIWLRNVEISDEEGVWASAKDIDLTWVPWDLWYRRLLIHQLSSNEIKIHRQPLVPKQEKKEESSFTESLLPKNPISKHFALRNIHIEKLTLDEELTGRAPLSLTVKGDGHFNLSGATGRVNIHISEYAPEGLASQIYLGFISEKEQIRAELEAAESSLGTVTRFLTLDPHPGVRISGSLKGSREAWRGALASNPNAPPIFALLDLNWSNPIEEDSKPFRLLGKELQQQVQVKWNAEKPIEITNIQLYSELAAIKGTATLEPSGRLQELAISGEILDWKTLEHEWERSFSGRLQTEIKYSTKQEQPQFLIRLEGDRVVFDSYQIETTVLQFDGNITKQGLKGTFRSDLTAPQTSFTGNALVDVNFQKELQINNITLKGWNSALNGNFSYSFIDHLYRANIEGQAVNLGLWSTFFRKPMTGSGDIKISAYPDPKTQTQSIDLFFKGKKIGFNDFHTDEIELNGTIYDATNQANASLKAEIKSAAYKDLNITSLSTTISPEPGQWPIEFQTKGYYHDSFDLSGSILYEHIENNTHILRMKHLAGKVAGESILLKEASRLEIRPGREFLSNFVLQIGQGLLKTHYLREQDTIDGECKAEDLQLLPFSRLFPRLSIKGLINGYASIKGNTQTPLAEFELNVEKIKVQDRNLDKLPAFTSALKGDLSNGKLNLKGTVSGIGNHPLNVEGFLPVTLHLTPLSLKVHKNTPFSINMKGDAELLPFLQLALPDTKYTSGKLDIDLKARGTLNDPDLLGVISIEDGAYESLNYGFSIEDLSAHISADGSNLYLENLHATDGKKGTLSANGEISADPLRQFPFTLQIEVQNMEVLDIELAKTRAEGSLSLNGNINRSIIEGTLYSIGGSIEIPKKGKNRLPEVEITFINNLPETAPPEEKHPRKDMEIDFDLLVKTKEPIRVHGRGLESTWTGEVALKGSRRQPELYGKLGIKEGQYFLSQRIFQVTEGNIRFDGPVKTNSTLEVTGQLPLSELVVYLHLSGLLQSPRIHLRSVPEKKLKDILSWVLFDKEVTEITSFEALQVASLALSISRGGELDLVGKLRSSLGLDRLDISSESNDDEDLNEISIEVGKYISKGVFVSVSRSIDSATNQVSVEASVSKEIKVQAEVGDNADAKLSTKWKRDY